MLRFIRPDAFLVGTTVLLAAAGCGGGHEAKPTAPAHSEEHAGHADGDHEYGDHEHGDHEHGDHEHAELGPHGGQLIELGKEEYHAELLHDDDQHKVTIYLLDGKAAETVATSAPEITIQVQIDGEPQRFALPAVRLDEAGPAKSFCFETTEDALSHALDEEGAKPTLFVDINGQDYTGAIVHDHEHAHEHKHSDEEHAKDR